MPVCHLTSSKITYFGSCWAISALLPWAIYSYICHHVRTNQTSIRPCQKRASDLIAKDIEQFNPTQAQTPAQKLQLLNRVKVQVKNHLYKLTNAVQFLIDKDNVWLNLIHDLPPDQQAAEESLYSEAILKDDGHYALITIGQDRIAEIRSILDEFDVLIASLTQQVQTDSVRDAMQPVLPPAAPQAPAATAMLKLPKIDLPKYNGDPTAWKPWWDYFNSAIHTNNTLTRSQKFTYLNSCLIGKAKKSVSGFAMTNDNYDQAITLLTHQFGQDSVIIGELFAKLRNFYVSGSQTSDLRSSLDFMESILRQLESLNQNLEQPVLVDMLRGKLPASVLHEMNKLKSPNEPWTVALIRKKLRDIIEEKEDIERVVAQEKKKGNPATRGSIGQRQDHNGKQESLGQPFGSATGLTAGVQPKNRGKQRQMANKDRWQMAKPNPEQTGWKPTCVFCDEQHYNTDCKKFPTVSARKKQLGTLSKVVCFRCLRPNHYARDCKQNLWCKQCRSDKHVRALCPVQFEHGSRNPGTNSSPVIEQSCPPTSGESVGQPTNGSQGDRNQSGVPVQAEMIHTGRVASSPPDRRKRTSLLLTAVTKLMNPGDSTVHSLAQIFFDPGAQRSFITQSMAAKLQLKSESEEDLVLFTFTSTRGQKQRVQTVSFEVLLRDGSKMKIESHVVPHLTNQQTRAALSEHDQCFVQRNYPVSFFADQVPFEQGQFKPDLLIGNDYFWDFMTNAPRVELPSGLYIIPSKLGLMLGGKQTVEGSESSAYSMQVNAQMDQSVAELNLFEPADSALTKLPNMEDYWKLDLIGVHDPVDFIDDEDAMNQFNESIQFYDGRYYVKWPRKPEIEQLPDNKKQSLQRFMSLRRKLQNEPILLERYQQIINEQLDKGIIEPVFSDQCDGRKFHYLPHHPVITPQKDTTKFRIVYDGSASSPGQLSLNECLLRGPVILPELCAVLLRFRFWPIGIIADVEKAFLQIGLQEEDRDLTRFWWFKDSSKISAENNLQIYRFCRVPFGVISSPFLLGGTIQYHLATHHSDVAEKLANSIYVDNVVSGVYTDDEAAAFYRESKGIFQLASMNLREYASNSQPFYDLLSKEDKIGNQLVKVLGLIWNTSTDKFSMKTPSMDKAVTKRGVLQTIGSIYDPLGLITPVTFSAKVLLQDLWKNSIKWDDPLPIQFQSSWEHIQFELQSLGELSFDRYVGFPVKDGAELHAFVDASGKAYSAVVYLRQPNECGLAHTCLLFAKLRLAPKSKVLTIPRLELLAVLIGFKLLLFLKEQLQIPFEKFFFGQIHSAAYIGCCTTIPLLDLWPTG